MTLVRAVAAALAMGVVACAAVTGLSEYEIVASTAVDAGDAGDAGIDVTVVPAVDAAPPPDASPPPPTCDAATPFDAPRPVEGLGSGSIEGARLSPDELVVFFVQGAEAVSKRVFSARRSTRLEPFTNVAIVPGSDVDGGSRDPAISSDLTVLYFVSNQLDGVGDVFFASRPSRESPFSTASHVQVLSGPAGAVDSDIFLAADGSEVFFASTRINAPPLGNQGFDLYHAYKTGSAPGAFSAPLRIDELSTASTEANPVISADGLTLFYAATPAAGGEFDILTATRPTRNAPFGPSRVVAELASTGLEGPNWLSPDNCRLYFERGAVGARSVFVAERPLPGR